MKVKELKPGQVFRYAGYEWIKLEQEGLALTNNILEERGFDAECNDWRKSKLRKYLNNEFYETLIENGADFEDFLTIETDLTADDGMKDYGTSKDLISLMTADLYRSNRHLLRPLASWWWLATPYSCLVSNSYNVKHVNSAGTLGVNYANYDHYGIRPLIRLYNDAEIAFDGEEIIETEEDTDTTEQIKQWAKDRELDKADPKAQMVKLLEELGELANGINKGKKMQIIDSIGDVYVVLTILSMQLGLDIENCIYMAYQEIKDRKGKIIDGVYVKEDDLE